MGWADRIISELLEGNKVRFRPRGSSMSPLIRSGDLCEATPICSCTVTDCTNRRLNTGEVVICKVNGRQYCHLIKGIRPTPKGDEFLIGNNRGGVNGWTHISKVYGKVTKVKEK